MYRDGVLGAVLASLFISGAHAEQFGGGLTASSGAQPSPMYAFSAGNLSPNDRGGARFGSQVDFGPAISVNGASATPLHSEFSIPSGAGGLMNAPSDDASRWTEARWAVASYLIGSSNVTAYGLQPTAVMASPTSMASLTAPRGGMYATSRGVW